MKRKFILYPAVALALMTSASLSSCVDTDEPDSLEALRNAKAEEIRANANLLNSQAEVEKAYVAVVNAKAAFDNAKVAGEEARSAMEQYKAALDKAQKDQAIAEIQAGSADNIEAAKLDAEKAKLAAEAGKITEGDNALLTAKAAAEAAAVTYKAACDKAKLDLVKEELTAAFNAARLEAETAAELGDKTPALKTAYTKWQTAITALETAKDKLAKAYAAAVKDPKTKNELVKTVADKEKALDDAVSALEKFNNQVEEAKSQGWLQGESVWKILVDEVNGYKAIVEGNEAAKYQAAILKEKTKETQDSIQDIVDDLTTKFDNIKQGAVDALNTYKSKEVNIEVECKNTNLQSLVGAEVAFSESGKFEWKDGKYVSNIKFRQDDIKGITDALNKLKEKFNTYATDQLGQNQRAFAAIAERFASTLNDLKKTVETNTNSLKKNWTSAVNEYQKVAAGTDKAKYNTAVGKLETAVQALFGDAGYAAGDGWQKFTTLDVYDSAVDYFTKKEMADNKDLSYDDARKIAWGKLGQFGELQKAEFNDSNNDVIVATLSDASDMTKKDGTIDAVAKKFSDNLATENGKVTAFNTNEAGKATYDALQDNKKKLEEAKKKATAATEAYNDIDFQSKYADEKYKWFTTNADSPVKAAIEAGAIKKQDNGYLTIPTPSAPQALVDAGIIENGNIVTEAAIAALKADKEKTKANAEIELEEAKADVVNFDAGKYGEKATIDPLIDAVAEKEAELAKAEEEYKKELSYLGK